MAAIDENTNLEISLKAVISIVFAVFTLTTAFVTLDGRIISLESSQAVQDMIIKENQSFTREWPLGLRGALPDDLIQNAEIMALKEKQGELKELREEIRRMQLEIGQLNAHTSTQEEKIETLFDIYNLNMANEK